MGKVISLREYKHNKKKLFMKKNRIRLNQFMKSFVDHNFHSSFQAINERYQACLVFENAQAWDYQDFREVLIEAVTEAFGQQLWEELIVLFWFEPQYISRGEVIDLCISEYILHDSMVANQ